jgi:predicted RNA-binding protein with PIN domain
MPYIIDGHNLIGQLADISLDDPNDEALLAQKLAGFAARTGKRCVVVFDYGLPAGKSRMSTRSVQIVFASARSSADRVMMERINKTPDPQNWIAVTSDHDVAETARKRRMGVMTSLEFADLLAAPPKPVVDEGEAADVSLSSDEVDEWLDLFGGSDKDS